MNETKLSDVFLDMAGDPELKKRFMEDPRGVFAERGIEVPAGLTLKVLEDTENVRHIVLPHLSTEAGHTAEEMEMRILKSMGYVIL